MKSITVTMHRSINYGAVLQSLALHKTQQELGIDNVLLDYYKPHIFPKVNLDHLFSKRGLLDGYFFLETLAHYPRRRRLYDSFNSFVETNIKTVAATPGDKASALRVPEADFYLSGSDQVFALRGAYPLVRNLAFIPNDCCKFSYAASVAEYDWNDGEKETFRRILKEYSKISVREESGRDYLQELCEKEISVHLDPVFLFDQDKWASYAKEPRVTGAYILCYPLLGNDLLQPVVDELKRKYHCPVVCVQTNSFKRIRADKYICDASPEEFVGLIKNAEAVVTTSFHGTAFSVLFEKDFYSVIKNYKSERMTDLLKLVGLSDRIVRKSEDVLRILDAKFPDYVSCAEIIRRERERSLDYLQQCIQIVENKKR